METSRSRTPRLASIQQRSRTLAVRLRKSELEHLQVHIAQERPLQLQAQTLRKSQDPEQQTANITHEREIKLRELRDRSEAQPQLLKTQWKYQMSQQATL